MAGFVENFLSSFMAAKQLEDQHRREEDRQVRAAVDDWIKMQEMRQNDRYHQDQLKSLDTDRQERRRLAADTAADREKDRAFTLDLRAQDLERKAKDDAATAKRDRIKNRVALQGQGWSTGQAMSMADYTPDEINAEMTPVFNQRNSAIQQQNMGAMGQNVASLLIPQFAQMMAGGLPVQTPTLEQQPMQAPLTMNDVLGEVAPLFTQKQQIADARVDNYGSMIDLRGVQSEIAQAREKRLAEMQKTDQDLKRTQMELNEARKVDIPKARLSLDAYREGVLDHQKAMEGIAKLNGEYRRGGADRQKAVQDAKNLRDWYVREDTRVGSEIRPLRAEEEKAAAQHILVGQQIAALQGLGASITPKQMEELNAAHLLWKVGEQRLQSITGRIHALEAERAKHRESLRALSGVGETPVTPSGSVKAAPAKTGGLPRISTDAEAAQLPSGAKFIGPDGKTYAKPHAVTRQFKNDRTGQLEWFVVKNGQWVKDGTPHVNTVAEAKALPPGTKFYDPNGVLRVTGGQSLDEGTARTFLQKAGGNKDRARKMAREAGYAW